jgi:DNA-binding beta-propeller fold protein YncE
MDRVAGLLQVLRGTLTAGLTAVAALAGAGCSAAPMHSGAMPATPAQVEAPGGTGASFLYAGGGKLSKYGLDDSRPQRSRSDQVGAVALALDRFGNLFAGNGSPSWGTITVYDAATLKLRRSISGIDGIRSVATDRQGYLYVATCYAGIYVFAPGSTHIDYRIRRGAQSACSLGFDSLGDLYGSDVTEQSVSVYAPSATPGRMHFLRRITSGLRFPSPLLVDTSDYLYVANCADCYFGGAGHPSGFVSVYLRGASSPSRIISAGIYHPFALAVDSTGRLYVGNRPVGSKAYKNGFVSVYAAGAVKPLRKITDGINVPGSLAIDPAGNLYVANLYADTVTVYSPGGAKLLRTIRRGVQVAATVLVGAP